MAEFLAPRNLKLLASVTEAVSSLTITDPFVAAGESAAPPSCRPQRPLGREVHLLLPQLQRRLFQANKAWKLGHAPT